MGASESSNYGSSAVQKQMKENYSFYLEYQDKRFGNIITYKNRVNDDIIAMKAISLDQGRDKNRAQNHLNIISRGDQTYCLQIHYFEQGLGDQILNFNDKMNIYFELHIHDLEIELKKRRATENFFTLSEVLYLVESLLCANQNLQNIRMPHGDLRPVNIFLNKQGQIKLADRYLLYSHQSIFNLTLQAKDFGYFSPQLFYYLKLRTPEANINQVKCDVFSLGIMLIEILTLSNAISFFDLRACLINWEFIENCLSECEEQYGSIITNLIRQMLTQQDTQRPDFEMLYNELQSNGRDVSPVKKQIQTHVMVPSPQKVNSPIQIVFPNQNNISPVKPNYYPAPPITPPYVNPNYGYNQISNPFVQGQSPINYSNPFNQGISPAQIPSPVRQLSPNKGNVPSYMPFPMNSSNFQPNRFNPPYIPYNPNIANPGPFPENFNFNNSNNSPIKQIQVNPNNNYNPYLTPINKINDNSNNNIQNFNQPPPEDNNIGSIDKRIEELLKKSEEVIQNHQKVKEQYKMNLSQKI